MTQPVYARVLGPLTLALQNRNATPTAQKQRQLLALLLVRHSSVVPVSTMIEELWSENPPRSAVTVVQTYVLGIRKRMAEFLDIEHGEVADRYLRTWSKGYLFDARDCVLDVKDYRIMAEAARCAAGVGNDRRAVELYTASEALWTGPPLLDVEAGNPLNAELTHLQQLRLVNQERRIEAQLRIGDHREVCPDLARLTAEQPLHERMQAYYMYALCRAGQRYRALQVYQDFAQVMQRELGLDPCWKLRQLHLDILNAADESVAEVLESRHAGYLIGWNSTSELDRPA
ncbi:AfsR/SARP family transcriptional regulator [Nocardia yamanashiensis]|uniref:AfsR/SARP family transcriptional regulator n=1 Tax=Nocardia yamanashiensis TaxID=209247 RepID=UPI001E61E374|nr:AfsR/SARP family transcriptional regulator [Nocardia yamanashiensis]UGT43611.1 AfsR/SARP family transcriptional regulator [Nocardia yamanashiensis]